MKRREFSNQSAWATWPCGLTCLPWIVLLVACAGETLPLDDPDSDSNTGGGQSSDGQSSDGQSSDGQSSDGQSSSTSTSGSTTAEPLTGAGLKDVRMTTFVGEPYGTLGPASAIVGDMDGDEYAELVLLDYGGSSRGPSAAFGTRGAAYLFYGRPTFPETIDVSDADLILRGASESVTGLGDIDGDGYPDLAFSASCEAEADCSETNGVHIIYGGAERLSGEFRSDELGLHWTNGEAQARYLDVSAAGDVNDDGLPDMLFDVGTDTDARPLVATSYLLFGRSDRSQQAPEPGASDARFEGSGGQQVTFGSAGAGDVDGDGSADLLISTVSDDTTVQQGAIGLFYGGAGRFAGSLGPADADATFDWTSLWYAIGGLGDLDNDGFDDMGLPLYAGAQGSELRVVYGQEQRFSGSYGSDVVAFSVATPSGEVAGVSAGDIDDDGHLDLVVGDSEADTFGFQAGALILLPGAAERPSGWRQVPPEQIQIFGRSTDDHQPRLGSGAASGGDVNGDGHDDVLATALGSTVGDEHGGRAYLYLGGEFE